MYYNYYQTAHHEYDECTAKGICSINPALTSLQEVVLLHLKELSYYLLKLHELGVHNQRVKDHIIFAISSITCNTDYHQHEFDTIISTLHEDISQAKTIYADLCKRHNLECINIKTYFKYAKKYTLNEAIRRGEKYALKRNSLLSEDQKNLFDMMILLVKSLCIKYMELKSFGKDCPEACFCVLSLFSAMNFLDITVEELKKEISGFIEVYYELVKKVFYTQIENYGEITLSEVPFSIKAGKAILVSGSDLKELELLLKATQNKGINIYTQGIEMLMANSLPKFKTFKHLAGHYGGSIEHSIIDFATFPGAILMTRHSLQRIESLYRGRLFTTDIVAPRGVVKLTNNDFEPLIKSALAAKGFSKDKPRATLLVGYDEKEIMKKIDNVIDKMESGEIKHLYFVGLLNYPAENIQYFEKFFRQLPKNHFVLSLSIDKKAENILHIDSFYEYSLAYKILKRMKERKPLKEYELTIFITSCDKHIVANVINLKNMGVKNIYLCRCSPLLINPPLLSTMRKVFDIKEFSDTDEGLPQINKIKGGGI